MRNSARASVALLLGVLLSGCDNTTAAEYHSRAQSSYSQGEYRTAVIELKNALQKQGDLVSGRELLGKTYFKLADYPGAIRELERAIDLGAPPDAVEFELLSAKNRVGRHSEVIGALVDRSDLQPRLLAVLGDAYFAGGDISKAREHYQRALTTAAANLGLGRLAWADGDTERARSYLTQAVELDADSADALLSLAEFELAQGDLAAARQAFQSASETLNGAISGELGLARVALADDDLTLARTHIDSVLAAAPQFFLAHYLDGLVRFSEGDLDGAEAALREVQTVAPEHGPTLFLMGAVKYQQGQLFQAQDNLQRYLSLDPGNESAAKVLASVYLQQQDVADVVELLAPFMDNSADPQLLAMYGSAQLRLGNAAEATEALQAAVELAPDAAAFQNQLALSLLSAGEEDQAEAALKSAIEVDGDQFQSEYLLAMMRLRDGEFSAAMEPIDALISKNPDSPIGPNLKGGAYMGLEQSEQAEAAFSAALEIDRGYLPAARNLARLDLLAGNADAARGRYEAVLSTDPENSAAALALAELALQQGDRAAAEAQLTGLLERAPDSVAGKIAYARLLYSENRGAEAVPHIEAALSQAPENPELLLLAAQMELARGDIPAARDHTQKLQRALASSRAPQILTTLGALQLRTGEFTLARRNLQLAMSEAPDSVDTLVQMMRLNLREGELAAARGNLDSLASLSGREQEVELLEARLLQAEGSVDDAMTRYRGLAAQGVRDAALNLIALGMARDDADLALGASDAWLAAHPDDAGVRLLRADVLLRSADHTEAIAEYERLVAAGNNPVALNNLAWLYQQAGDGRALETAQRAYELAPDNADIADTLGWTLVQSNRAEEGLRYLQQSHTHKADNPAVVYHLAVARSAVGDVNGALELLAPLVDGEVFTEQSQAQALQRQLLQQR